MFKFVFVPYLILCRCHFCVGSA